jgi:hypothetical protein
MTARHHSAILYSKGDGAPPGPREMEHLRAPKALFVVGNVWVDVDCLDVNKAANSPPALGGDGEGVHDAVIGGRVRGYVGCAKWSRPLRLDLLEDV